MKKFVSIAATVALVGLFAVSGTAQAAWGARGAYGERMHSRRSTSCGWTPRCSNRAPNSFVRGTQAANGINFGSCTLRNHHQHYHLARYGRWSGRPGSANYHPH